MAKARTEGESKEPVSTFTHIPPHRIEIGAQMVRHDPHDDDIAELAADIAAHGLMQPIGVSRLPNDRFQLLWGSRRLAAHQRLGARTILARICDEHTPEQILSAAVRENLLRRDLTLKETIDALRRFTTDGLSPAQISDLVGKSRNWVDRRLAFDQLPPEIRDYALEGTIPLGHAEALALIKDTAARSYLTTWTLQNRPSLVTLRASIEAIAATPTFGEAVEAGAAAAQQTTAVGTVHLPCYVCNTPTPITQLIIIRCCAPCTHAMQGAGSTDANATDTH